MKKTLAALLLAACSAGPFPGPGPGSDPGSGSGSDPGTPDKLAAIDHVVVIFAENHSFDNLFGDFPGARGIADARDTALPQFDRDGTIFDTLPQSWGGVTAPGVAPAITQAMSAGLPNDVYALEETYPGFDDNAITRDLYHRFFENQMQIDGGYNDMFAAYADSGGLVMGTYDGRASALYGLAQDYTLADNFFMGAFGGSFLNHQYLICGCAPEFPDADTDPAAPTIAQLDDSGFLALADDSPASALDGPPKFALSGNLVPKDYFGDGTFRAVNTMGPPYQPSFNPPAADDAGHLYADRAKATTLPPQTAPTIGDRLSDAGVSWAWYAGAWKSTLAIATGDRMFPSSTTPGSAPNFQFHHQPFNYYAAFDPTDHADARDEHMKDYEDLIADVRAGTLPQVTFYKPEGDLNQHAGYASVGAGDQHIANLVAALQASPQYAHMVIIVTYDENGGWYDHVAPPTGDKLGPGTRIPAIIISPYAKRGFVDHTQYDTGSITRLLDRRYQLDALPGIAARDAALQAAGSEPMGDLTNALELP